jgi:DHA2 family multidrug resistance protein
MAEHVSTFSAAYRNMLNGTQMKLVAAGSSLSHATTQAQQMIYGTLQRQAAMLAFIDNFKMLGVVFLVVLPVLLMLKKPSRQAGSAPVH